MTMTARSHIFQVFALVILSGFLAGCSGLPAKGPRFDPRAADGTAAAPTLTKVASDEGINPDWLTPPSEPHRLGPGDRIDIELLGEPEGTVSTFVGPDGRIYFHLLPGLQVWGQTLAEVKKALEKELAQYVRDPQVSITLRDVQSRSVWVLGRVVTPGIYTLDMPMTVLEAITKAGGLFTSRFSGSTEELADLHHSFLIRGGQPLPINFHELVREGDTTQNVYLKPDDFIYLPSALTSEVYVLGAVYQPQAVGFKDQVTLVSAIAHARGTIQDAWLKHVAIVRGSLAEPSIAVVDYTDIVTGKAPDVSLEPRDIVYVPFSPYRTLRQYTKLIVNTFVKTVAANEGGRAVDPDYQSPGVSIPISQQ